MARDAAVLALDAIRGTLFDWDAWLQAAEDAAANPPLRGFLAERLVLEAIREHGLPGLLGACGLAEVRFESGHERVCAAIQKMHMSICTDKC